MLPCDVEARKQCLERRVAIDEGGDEVGSILDRCTERIEEEGEEDECEEVGDEG